MNLVVNEWLLEYFLPGTPCEDGEKLKFFFDSIQECNRKMVIGRETPFTKKYYKFMKLHGNDTKFKNNFKNLNAVLFKDSAKTILVEKNEVSKIPDADMEGVDKDDRYLLELVASVPDSTIVSTDNRLLKALEQKSSYPIIHLSEYLRTYKEKGCK